MAFLKKTTTIPLAPSKVAAPISNIYPILGFIGIIASTVAIMFLLFLLFNAWPFAKTTATVDDYKKTSPEKLDLPCSSGYEQSHHQSLIDEKKQLDIPKGIIAPDGQIPCNHSKYFKRP
jgi:hypothetical protein